MEGSRAFLSPNRSSVFFQRRVVKPLTQQPDPFDQPRSRAQQQIGGDVADDPAGPNRLDFAPSDAIGQRLARLFLSHVSQQDHFRVPLHHVLGIDGGIARVDFVRHVDPPGQRDQFVHE